MNLHAEPPSLDKISEAITVGNASEVKALWKRIERYASLNEQQKALTELIEQASELTYEHKKNESSSGRNYMKIVPGALITATGVAFWAYAIKWAYIDRNLYRRDLPAYYALVGLSGGLIAGGRYLLASGWKTGTHSASSTSEWQKILSFLEKQLDDVKDQLKNVR